MEGIQVRGLTCDYGDGPVLKDLFFSISRGEAVGIVGPSGCGKTTLAYCLTGIIPNRVKCEVEGEVLLDGESLFEKSLTEVAGKVNIVMQNYEVQIFGLTVEEDIVFGLENLGLQLEEIGKRLEWALKTFNLEKYRHYRISELSGGLKQRVVVASTVVLRPDFIVMDDPTSNLDWRGVKSLRDTIRMLKSQNRGVVVLARRIKGLREALDRVYVLEEGRLREAEARETKNTVVRTPAKRRVGGEPVIEVENLWFRYLQEYVLRDVSLRINSGEVVAIMGPNGSGKTTLVKHFNGLLKPTKGSVKVLGMDVSEATAAQMARHVAFVFQDPDRHITCNTVWEEAVFGCRNLGLPEENAKQALASMGLLEKADRPPYSLSMGEKTRLSIASALAMNPRIFILDEPTTGQDRETLRVIRDVVWKLRDEGKTVIIVTHDSDFALEVSDRGVVVYNGEIVADSTPEDILLNKELLERYELEPPEAVMGEVGVGE